jgi:Dolichyl-phosphate-mannose-protein mannosyltransferase
MLDLGLVLALTVLAIGVGLRLLDHLGGRPDVPADALALAIPLGLGTFALATLGLGEVGFLNRAGLAALLAIGAVVGGPEGWRGLIASRRRPHPNPLPEGEGAGLSSRRGGIGLPDLAFALALGATLIGTLLTALAPVTDGDALCYHLQVPKVFLDRGSVGFEPDLHETVYPLLTEMLFADALALRGPVACRLISWVLGLAFAANVAALARPSLGRRAWWAGTVALLVPAVSNGMGAPLNDVALAAFGNAAIGGWLRFHDHPSARRALLAGILAGLALGVKYPALVLAGLLGLAVAASAWGRCANRKEAIRRTLVFAATALLVGGVWYLRAWRHTGNPVFPFFRHVFGGAGLDAVLDRSRRPMPVDPFHLLTAIAPMTLRPARFDSFAHQFGPAFLLFLPALLIERAPRRVLAIVVIGYAFLTLCVSQRQSMRFVLAAVGPASVGVAWLAREWWGRRTWPGRALVAGLSLVLTFEAGLSLARARHGLPVVLGREDADHYLARREPSYRVGRWMSGNLPEGARVVGQDHRGYYLPRPYAMELAHRRRTGLGGRGESAGAVVERLRSEGFTHVLLCPPVPETAVEFDPTLGRLLAPWLAGRDPLYREEIADGDGVVRRYAIYRLDDPALASADNPEGARR